MKLNYFYLVFFFFLFSCSQRDIVYFSDLDQNAANANDASLNADTRIQADDLLSIVVSSLNPESNVLFNNGVLQIPGGSAGGTAIATNNTNGYLVDQNGEINFPVLGKLKIGGLTKTEATAKLTQAIERHVKNPIVNIRFLNFRVTVLGEVNNPSTFIIPTEKVNILDVLGLAGDMTVYGKRENVLIVREQDNVRKTIRVNLNSQSILNSPQFYLQKNDIVYVEPEKSKAAQANISRTNATFALSIVTALSVLIFRFL